MSWTLCGRCEHLLEVKKSRFLALAAPVESTDAALAFIADVSDAAATHNCWGWRIGQAYRFNDDGEPGGTAGRPILAAIDGSGLDGVVAVVTRWYGGIKLGAGGLVRAYGGAVAECLRQAPRIERIRTIALTVHCGFEHAGAVHAVLRAFPAGKVGEQFSSEGIALQVQLPLDRVDAFSEAVRDASRGRARIER